MPRYRTVRGNTTAARFPFISDFSGRSVIISQLDMNTQRGAPGDEDKDSNVPQIFYMHNCIPLGNGIQSIGYERQIDSYSGGSTDFDTIFTLRSAEEYKVLFCPAAGKNYIFNPNDGVWVSVNPIIEGTISTTALVTVATAQGRTIIFYENYKALEYDFTLKTISEVTLTGLTSSALLGVCASNNYLIAFDSTTIYWSGLTDITDFTPSLISGAGSGTPSDLRGSIVTVLPVNNGFIIYTTDNAILASYTGNIRYPWQFREIANSPGVSKGDDVAWRANLTFHYAWTNSGMMKVDRTLADQQFPDLTDFVASRVFEDFDEVTETFTTSYLANRIQTKLAFIGSRFLIFSYGISSLTHALLYDTALKRWGKLKFPHVAVFEYPPIGFYSSRTYGDLADIAYSDLGDTTYADFDSTQAAITEPKHEIAFLQADGAVYILRPELDFVDSSGVLFIGKYQLVRVNACTMYDLTVENSIEDADLTVKIFTSWKGKSFSLVTTPYKYTKDGLATMYKAKVTGINHTLGFFGKFNLLSFIFSVATAGWR